eukprot:CAMPEP_0182418032 /NCGR_PEP_ID=MMETSP1167-20130531/2486_1 /TAXON_ID=2988 /ORGANISM="Mallomonas Sp, Strain CCMP3275" /LENGTH=529 /DNA_ID=CAMNT_0024591985 /DNA_START=62 /DNA_END=1651 /DNA_ORIENTATION=-
MEKCNFGIMGCANIARKNSKAIMLSKNAHLYAVASRSLEKCGKWCSDNEIPAEVKQYGSYQELLDDPEVHAVYMPLPTKMHLEWVTKAARAKKHVLVEKPAATSERELCIMLKECKENGVQWMDGVMFMHHPRLQLLKALLAEPDFGRVHHINSSFCFSGNDQFLESNIRCSRDGDPLGALGDLGWYCIRLSMMVYNRSPRAVQARCHLWNSEGIPMDCEGRIYFSDNNHDSVCYFYCSFLSPWRNAAEISVKGPPDKVLRCNDFVLPVLVESAVWTIETQHKSPVPPVLPPTHTSLTSPPCRQEADMFDTFSSLVMRNTTDLYWPQISTDTQLIVDACMESMHMKGIEVPVRSSDGLNGSDNRPPIPMPGPVSDSISESRRLQVRSEAAITRVLQTEFEASRGNCLQATVASMFGLSRCDFEQYGGALPKFISSSIGYEQALKHWGAAVGYIFTKVGLASHGQLTTRLSEGTLCIVRGTSPRGNWGHAVLGVVSEDGLSIDLIHDPHPDGTMLDSNAPIVWAAYFSVI